ncbi:2834_t:CDS:1 [Dentiscutata erythropus]|uniref:2834_t:CDS:1 n=1 Tax=Dentiscutata erythropus TaxID=1348616 RepID=A0A9N9J6B4_9GLOM|nr:2834_t:CDS:1 [Dentiscutata erythropus]
MTYFFSLKTTVSCNARQAGLLYSLSKVIMILVDEAINVFVTVSLHLHFFRARSLKTSFETLPGATIGPENMDLFFAVIFCNLMRAMIISMANIFDISCALLEDQDDKEASLLTVYSISSVFWVFISHIVTSDMEIVKFLKKKGPGGSSSGDSRAPMFSH